MIGCVNDKETRWRKGARRVKLLECVVRPNFDCGIKKMEEKNCYFVFMTQVHCISTHKYTFCVILRTHTQNVYTFCVNILRTHFACSEAFWWVGGLFCTSC